LLVAVVVETGKPVRHGLAAVVRAGSVLALG
jgi:hypothetical protein